MKAVDYVIDFLIKNDVTDIFGVPGGVVLDFIYAADSRKDDLNIHLSGTENSAGFSAVGYAQSSGKLGVAYATRGPGLTNMYTSICDAYFDSLPVLFITAHSKKYSFSSRRIEEEQEFDTVSSIKNVTKYSARIEELSELKSVLSDAVKSALSSPQGPVFIDFLSGIFKEEIDDCNDELSENIVEKESLDFSDISNKLNDYIASAEQPIILFGSGIRQSGTNNLFADLVQKMRIPVLSSFIAQDVIPSSEYYFGYIGSHGLRQANYILSKSDLIISFGNRMSYNRNSVSFGKISEKKTIRFDVDINEVSFSASDEIIHVDLVKLIPYLVKNLKINYKHDKWLSQCADVKKILCDSDIHDPVKKISDIIKNISDDASITVDVGNNEFWVTRAYYLTGKNNRLIMSKSFSALGCSLPKGIGVYFASKKPAIVFMGDHALLFNLSDLHFISINKIPIIIVLINNQSSGMIKSQQKNQKRGKYIHTTNESGYLNPDYHKIVEAFNIKYCNYDKLCPEELNRILSDISCPVFIELKIDSEIELPKLPRNNVCYDFEPKISEEKEILLNKI